ncbi:MAG TPA: MarR family transcriptional regulator [Jatrophihabitans sp.]|jgi:DNA-binding MarR family transcriptional regulator|uniref:MarR family winged helix-turn-helix transcriptional regulator n=1 Tax=Jatrophihabitans sp. TaxID=1932789 RepID=UPI002F0BCFAF
MTPRDVDGLQAWRAMLLAYNAAMRAIDADLEASGSIPLTWYDVLLELNAAPEGRLRMQELSDRVVLSRTRVSRLVDEMVIDNLVAKVRDDDDRRVVWAKITDVGRKSFRETAPRYLRGIEEHFSSHLTDAERRVLTAALGKVAASPAPSGSFPLPVLAGGRLKGHSQ